LTIWPQKLHPLENFFFSVGNNFFYFTTLMQLPMTGLKIEFSNNFLTGCLSHLLGPVSDKNYTPLETFFFQKKTKKNYFTSLNQLPMASLKI
jgi:hypothetical protein